MSHINQKIIYWQFFLQRMSVLNPLIYMTMQFSLAFVNAEPKDGAPIKNPSNQNNHPHLGKAIHFYF